LSNFDWNWKMPIHALKWGRGWAQLTPAAGRRINEIMKPRQGISLRRYGHTTPVWSVCVSKNRKRKTTKSQSWQRGIRPDHPRAEQFGPRWQKMETQYSLQDKQWTPTGAGI